MKINWRRILRSREFHALWIGAVLLALAIGFDVVWLAVMVVIFIGMTVLFIDRLVSVFKPESRRGPLD
jgi:hypothetical protein